MGEAVRYVLTCPSHISVPDQPQHPWYGFYSSRRTDNLDTDVLFFQTFGTKWIVLNSLKASSELLDQRGSNYADRPRFVMFEEYVKKKIQKIPVNHDVSSAL